MTTNDSGPEHAPRAAATFELSVALTRATGDSYFAQHAVVQLADSEQHFAVQPSAAQHSQSAHDVHPHGQSAGQQQQPPASSAETVPPATACLSSDSPASIATITITAANTAT